VYDDPILFWLLALEIEAHVPEGIPDNVVRTVTENSRTLKLSAQEFEQGVSTATPAAGS
jgi:hypothetical protein